MRPSFFQLRSEADRVIGSSRPLFPFESGFCSGDGVGAHLHRSVLCSAAERKEGKWGNERTFPPEIGVRRQPKP